jgi:hypothetical protein
MMASLVARRTPQGWKVSLGEGAAAQTPNLPLASRAGREKAWQLARALGRTRSPWDLEYQKAALGSPEITLGYAHLLADDCEALAGGTGERSVSVPSAYASVRSANRELACRGLAQQSFLRLQSWLDRLRFTVAGAAAMASLLAYAVTVGRRGNEEPATGLDSADLALALHGERATRTQHLLKAAAGEAAPARIILIGRLRTPLAGIRAEWGDLGNTPLPPMVHPFTAASAVRALPRMVRLLAEGLREAPARHYLPPLREHVAIVFRVLLGAAMQEWWNDRGLRLRTVVFGHTGTADVSMLEAAMQAAGSRTVHVVHGLATGPNFTGFSDEAWFRCGFDADQYARLGTYGECRVQEAPAPTPVRGRHGVYLLSNLAHPMNPNFVAKGPADEIELLRCVAAASREVCPEGQRMVWRPHPVIRRLSAETAKQIRDEARRLGFEEQDHSEPIGPSAAAARWVITSPSTTAIDLLVQGTLCVVVDLQNSAAGTAPAQFPAASNQPAALAALLREIDDDAAHAARFNQTWNAVRPAMPLDLAALRPTPN